jgi:hypothetical protein
MLSSSVNGRLTKCAQYWPGVGNPQTTIGYCPTWLHFALIGRPNAFAGNNYQSVKCNSDFVTETVSELLLNSCAWIVHSVPSVCSQLLWDRQIVERDYKIYTCGKIRLKMRVSSALNCFIKMTTKILFDLKSGYHLVDIQES